MHEWARYNERIIEILIARKSENIEIIIIIKDVSLYFLFWPKKNMSGTLR